MLAVNRDQRGPLPASHKLLSPPRALGVAALTGIRGRGRSRGPCASASGSSHAGATPEVPPPRLPGRLQPWPCLGWRGAPGQAALYSSASSGRAAVTSTPAAGETGGRPAGAAR